MQLDLLAALGRGLAGHYAVTREIGRGGMAVVYECRDLIAERDVAIKLLYPDLARAVGGDRFLREIRILQQLSHPNILPLLDSGSIEILPGLSLPWYAMPLAREETLRARLGREGALPLATALGYARDLCSALTHAHSHEVIHRDIKPENILLVEGHAVLADFGIARAITLAGGDTLSTTGIVVGTPVYMSPEQSTGARQLDGRSDLYSLGVVLYEMLAGHAPFSGSTPQAISARHQFETPPPISVVRPGLPASLARVLRRCLEKVPGDRYATPAEFNTALEGHAEQAKRRRMGQGVALGTLLLLVVGAIGLMPRGPAPLDDRILVLPFQQAGTPGMLIGGGDCATLIYDAIADFRDLARVDRLTTQNAIALRGVPKSLREGTSLARALGAGRLIWGEIYQVGDSIRVLASLYRVTPNGQESLSERSLTLPGSATVSAGAPDIAREVHRLFGKLARSLLLAEEDAASGPFPGTSTLSFKALKANNLGDSAMAEWNLPLAREQYTTALRYDAGYVRARLNLATLDQLLDAPASSWRPGVVSALQGAGLDSLSRWRAKALLALADGDYPETCGINRRLLARDSLDFRAWLGLGDCLIGDNAIVRTSGAHRGLRFRSSLNEAASAYLTALRALPLAHRAARGAILPRLFRALPTGQFLRSGQLVGQADSNYLAWVDAASDTMVFTPIPTADFSAGTAPLPPTGAQLAFSASKERLKAIVGEWTATFPASSAAWAAQATVFERIGIVGADSVALIAIRRAAELAGDSSALLEILLDQTGIALKSGRVNLAERSASTVLSGWPPIDAGTALRLAPLAALLGREQELIRLLRLAAEAWTFRTPDGRVVTPPPGLAAEALAYYGYAVMGQSPDSIRTLADRVTRAIVAWSPRDRRAAVTLALTEDASYYGFATVGPGPAHTTPGHGSSLQLQLLSISLDRGQARQAVRAFGGTIDSLSVSDVAPESALEASRQLLLMGDTALAVAILDRELGSLGLQQHLTRLPQATAALVRLARLRQQLPHPAPTRVTRALASLWHRPE